MKILGVFYETCYCRQAEPIGTELCCKPCFECGIAVPNGTYICVACDTPVNYWTTYTNPVQNACVYDANSTRQLRY